MGKKVSALSYLYLLGMALVAIGFCCPMIKGLFGTSANGFDFIRNVKDGSFVAIGAILIFAGAVAGIVACFVPQLSGLKLIFALAVLAGAIVLIIGFTTNGGIYKAIGKQLLKRAMFGFYMVVAGIVLAICGATQK
ncbi:MAG: hypothetical protein J6X84_04005 [Treponema sp.]|nr:hypothetical protein [Treponema sp.]